MRVYHLVFSWLYFFIVYTPFFIFMLWRHDVAATSLSAIGWITGGLHYLATYILLTVPYCLYLVLFFNRHFAGNRKWIKLVSIISCAFIAIGSFIPLRESRPLLLFTHTFVSVASTVVFMLTIMAALVLHALTKKHKAVILSLYGLYAAALLTAFYILLTAALFQFMATVSFFIILLGVMSSQRR